MKEAIIQVGGRNFVIFALIEAEPRMQVTIRLSHFYNCKVLIDNCKVLNYNCKELT